MVSHVNSAVQLLGCLALFSFQPSRCLSELSLCCLCGIVLLMALFSQRCHLD